MVACTPQPEQRKIVFPEGEELSAPTAATLGGKNKTPWKKRPKATSGSEADQQ